MGLRISELAGRTGFSPSTLRYYETVGLLDEPGRTTAGYRVYDDAAVERLAFIARAKGMGLSLDEIAELVALWADGPCAPVQERLADLLDAKISDVHGQLAELSGFAAQLEHLRRSLVAVEPPDRCGPGCGCDASVTPTPVPIACTLAPGDAPARSAAWAGVLAGVTTRQRVRNGIRLGLPADPATVARVAELATLEAECCAFFSFALTVDASGPALVVTAPPAGQDVLDALFGGDPGR